MSIDKMLHEVENDRGVKRDGDVTCNSKKEVGCRLCKTLYLNLFRPDSQKTSLKAKYI